MTSSSTLLSEGSGGRSGDAEARPLVSVVMPFKDAARFLTEAVESVLRQTWRTWELVLVDDGGADGSDRIAHALAASDQRLRVVAHDGRANRGTGPSRAFGISQTRGALVAFLDADDVWEPTHLEDGVRLLLEHPEADMVCGRVWAWRSWCDAAADDELSKLAFAAGASVPAPGLLTAVLRNGGLATATSALLVRRSVLVGCLPHLERFPGMYEDQVINSWLQLRVTAVMSGATSAWYRQHPSSFTSPATTGSAHGSAIGRVDYLEWLQARVEEIPDVAVEVGPLVDRALRVAQERAAEPATPQEASLWRRVPSSVRRPAGAIHRALTPRRRPTVGERASWVDKVLTKNAADVRGDVLLVGVADVPSEWPSVRSVHVLRWSPTPGRSGPHHPLADLPSRGFDCAVLDWLEIVPTSGDLGLRHLRRVLRPGGVVLLLSEDPAPVLLDELRQVFGWDGVVIDDPRDRPFVLWRAAIPRG